MILDQCLSIEFFNVNYFYVDYWSSKYFIDCIIRFLKKYFADIFVELVFCYGVLLGEMSCWWFLTSSIFLSQPVMRRQLFYYIKLWLIKFLSFVVNLSN